MYFKAQFGGNVWTQQSKYRGKHSSSINSEVPSAPATQCIYVSFAALPGDAGYNFWQFLTMADILYEIGRVWRGCRTLADNPRRAALLGNQDPALCKGVIPRGQSTACGQWLPASVGHFAQRWSRRDTQTGQQGKLLQRKVLGWQLRKERKEMAQVQHGTWCPSPRTRQPRGLLLHEHWASWCCCTTHSSACKHRGKTLDAMLSQQRV